MDDHPFGGALVKVFLYQISTPMEPGEVRQKLHHYIDLAGGERHRRFKNIRFPKPKPFTGL